MAIAAGGVATFTTDTLTAGTHPITGDLQRHGHSPSNDDLSQQVNKVDTTTSLA